MSTKPSAVPELTQDQALAISQAGWSLLHVLGEQAQRGTVSLAASIARATTHLQSQKVDQGTLKLQLQFLKLFCSEEGFNPFNSLATVSKVAQECASAATPAKRKERDPPSESEEEYEAHDEDKGKKKHLTRVQAAKTKWDTETLP